MVVVLHNLIDLSIMVLSKFKFNTFLCFLLPLAIGLTFPLQVIYGSSMAGAASLILLLFIILVSLFNKRNYRICLSKNKRFAIWDWFVAAFICLSFLNICISWLLLGVDSFISFLPPVFLVMQASMIYIYFSRMASKRIINSFLAGMVAMGLISGVFFVYESFNKLALGKITKYTQMAHEYSRASPNAKPTENPIRIHINYRSFGLLERNSTSAIWMIFGFFAYSFLATKPSKIQNVYVFTLIALLIAQNFTSIFVFLFVGLLVQKGIIKFRTMFNAVLFLTLPLIFINFDNIKFFLEAASHFTQSNLMTAFTITTEIIGTSYFSLVLWEFARYGRELVNFPHQLLIGFGLGFKPTYGTSGDVGFMESIMRLGLPLWMLFTWHIVGLLKRAVLSIKSHNYHIWKNYDVRLMVTSAAILSSIWLMDLHYTTWIHKSVFPILFFALALARRINSHTLGQNVFAST